MPKEINGVFYRECSKDNELCIEKEMEISHDIPKYTGGTDKDGRHWLCKLHHDIYERTILMRIFKEIFNELIPFCADRGFYSKYMSIINKSSNNIKERARKIAEEVCNEFYNKQEVEDGDTKTITE